MPALILALGCSRAPEPVPSLVPKPPPAAATNTAAGLAADPAATAPEPDPRQFEADYLAATQTPRKIAILTDLTDLPPATALTVFGRLFQQETSLELKEEILYTAADVEGELPAKLDLLAEAVAPNQPQALRLTAIEVLVLIDDPQVLAVLQLLAADPDPKVRADALEAMADMQNTATNAPPEPK